MFRSVVNIVNNAKRIDFYLSIRYCSLQLPKNLFDFDIKMQGYIPLLKRTDRLLTSLIHKNAMRIDFFYLNLCVTIL